MGDFFKKPKRWKITEKSKTEISGGFSMKLWTRGYFPLIFPQCGSKEPEIGVLKFQKSKGKSGKKTRTMHFRSILCCARSSANTTNFASLMY